MGGRTSTVILAGSGMRPGRSSRLTPKGGPIEIGRHLHAGEAVEAEQPGDALAAREEEGGLLSADRHHGHDRHSRLSASRMNPLRPAKSILSDSQLGRKVSWSPPG